MKKKKRKNVEKWEEKNDVTVANIVEVDEQRR